MTGKEIIAALRNAGFEEIREKGSHHFLQHPDHTYMYESIQFL